MDNIFWHKDRLLDRQLNRHLAFIMVYQLWRSFTGDRSEPLSTGRIVSSGMSLDDLAKRPIRTAPSLP